MFDFFFLMLSALQFHLVNWKNPAVFSLPPSIIWSSKDFQLTSELDSFLVGLCALDFCSLSAEVVVALQG